LGPKHPWTDDIAESYAILEARRGRLAESQQLFERSLTSYLASYGSKHPETLESRRNFAILLTMRGRHEEAIEQLREAAENGYAARLHLEESAFSQLRSHPAWPDLLAAVALKQERPQHP